MTLETGTRLGPYEVVAPLGAGGMGEVYKARDTRLGRNVAIKILPSEFAREPRLRVRFDREAKAISALNHPHICTLHDVGKENGIDYLVMEHCDGKTLARRLADGPLPLDDLLRYSVEIAEALDKAHRQGITHRDLKPSNIMITKAGVKVLDFGLARHAVTHSPDESTVEQISDQGTIVGTVQYMAPEILNGGEGDARSDIFALGLVMYEMATAKAAFAGTSKATIIAAILERQPPTTRELRADLPPLLHHIIERCLAKDPDARWQSAADIAAALRFVANLGDAPASPRFRHATRYSLLVTAAAGFATAAFMLWNRPAPSPTPQTGRFQIQAPPGIRVQAAGNAISPDGKWVAFRGFGSNPDEDSYLYIRSIDNLDARPLPGGRNATNPFFSPDSAWIGFAADGVLRKVAVNGAESVPICRARSVRGASWGEDDTIVFSDGDRLMRVAAAGGEPTALTHPSPGERHYWPRHLPGDRGLLYSVHNNFRESRRPIALLSLDTLQSRVLLPGGTYPVYSRTGHVIYSRTGILYAAPFDLQQLRVTGEPRPVLDDVAFQDLSGYAAFSVSATGSLTFVPGATRIVASEIVSIDRLGTVVPLIRDARGYQPTTAPIASPDGRKIAVAIASSVEEWDLWIYEIATGAWSRLTSGGESHGHLRWSPDGKWIYFTSIQSGNQKIARVAADGNSAPEELTTGIEWDLVCAPSPDGNSLLFLRQVESSQFDIFMLSLDGSRTVRPFIATSNSEGDADFSPDGHWVVYESAAEGPAHVWIRPFDGSRPPVRISQTNGGTPVWNGKKSEILYRCGESICATKVITEPTLRVGETKRLFDIDIRPTEYRPFSISPDGERIWMVRVPNSESRPRQVVYVPNWAEEMKRTYEAASKN